MGDNKERLLGLESKLSDLLKRQYNLQKDLNALNLEIKRIKLDEEYQELPETPPVEETIPEPAVGVEEEPEIEVLAPQPIPTPPEPTPAPARVKHKSPVDWEKLIGENIINKIGIIITLIGVAIGTTYVIENNLISPAARIMIGYVFSFGMAGVAYRLRKKYLNYSAVLLGGAMASMYLLTYAAYSYYALIPQLVTFILMTTITLFTVGAAVGYDREWVSVYGLVGGYAVPFLVGSEVGSTLILFSYILFINLGVLLVALYKYWRILFMSAFGFTWLIFLAWFFDGSPADRDVEMSLLFSSAFFLLFYAAFMIFKIREKEDFLSLDISTLLSNTGLYFGLGLETLNHGLEDYQGLFVVIVATIHFAVGRVIRKYELPSHIMQNFVNGLVLIFLTLAIPIQFTDKWITIAWSLESALLLWMGRAKKQAVFEYLAYPLMIFTVLSFIGYMFWFNWGFNSKETLPFINQLMLTFLIFWGAFAGIQYLLAKHKDYSALKPQSFFLFIAKKGTPVVLVLSLYVVFYSEISRIFTFWSHSTAIVTDRGFGSYPSSNPAISHFRTLWLFIYTIVFVFLGYVINQKWFKFSIAKRFVFGLSLILTVFFFVSFFDSVLSLREMYLGVYETEGFDQGIMNILMRYIFIGFGLLNIYTLWKSNNNFNAHPKDRITFELFLAFSAIFIASSELTQWLDIAGYENTYKLGLSILWGCSSLILVLLGIFKHKQHLRIGAMGVFSITLLKLFFYDISHLSTISKTIVFLALGILLLVISYLYNRFKDKLAEE